MLNSTIPILQMKISGVDLSTIQTMIIAMRNQKSTITKGNSDIEVDNDLISVFLTQEEAYRLDEGYFNISMYAVNIDGIDVSDNIKMIWAKRGSMSRATGEAVGPGENNNIWYPTVSADGEISWLKSKTDVPPAPQNIKGKNGKDGIAPRIGENGNWYIGDKDTKIKAEGENGFSPEIQEDSGNNDTVYKLNITTVDETFTTPNLKGKDGGGGGFEVLWENPDSESNFGGKDIVLTKSLLSYRFYIVIFKDYKTNAFTLSSGLICVGKGTIFTRFYSGKGALKSTVIYKNDTTLNISGCMQYSTFTTAYGSSLYDYNIPLMVLGCK